MRAGRGPGDAKSVNPSALLGRATLCLLPDHIGSVVAVLDGSGTVVGEQRYKPFGQPRLTPGIGQTDVGFTGQRSLAAAGLQDFNARWLDSSLGMFAAPDSLIANPFSPQSLNPYGYVMNNPLRYTDPTGLYVFEESPSDKYVSVSDPRVRAAVAREGYKKPNVVTTPINSVRIDPMYEVETSGHEFGAGQECPDYDVYEGRDECIHPGVDVKSDYLAVVAPASGDVFFMQMTNGSDDLTGFGTYAVLRVHGAGSTIYYHILAHLADNNQYGLEQGQHVDVGTMLGVMGKSGTGDIHLHWEVRVDPMGNMYNVDYTDENRPLQLRVPYPGDMRPPDMFYPRENKILDSYWLDPLSWANTRWYGPRSPMGP